MKTDNAYTFTRKHMNTFAMTQILVFQGSLGSWLEFGLFVSTRYFLGKSCFGNSGKFQTFDFPHALGLPWGEEKSGG